MHHDRDGRDIQQLVSLIQDTAVAVFVTAGAESGPRARPLPTFPLSFDGSLWYLVPGRSGVVGEIGREPGVLVTFAHPAGHSHVAVRGQAEERHDRSMVEALWRPGLRAWFPGGPTDPDLRLIRVTVERAEFWDAPAATGRVFRFGSAAMEEGPRTERDRTPAHLEVSHTQEKGRA